MTIGGTPGAAIAIVHDGVLIYTEYIGYQDLTKKIPINDEIVFPCASLTKAVVAAAVALCVEDGKLEWDTLVKDIVPGFRTRSKILHHQMTTVDCLSHRAGMQNSLVWVGSQNDVLITKDNSLNFINDLHQVRPFRNGYLYNNLGYEIAGHIIEAATGQPWGRIVHSSILEPLGMTRTGTRAGFCGSENVTKTYQALDDASTVEVTPLLSGDDSVGGAGCAMRSCVRDLAKLYTAFLTTRKHQIESNTTTTPGSPLKQVPFLFSPQISMNKISERETSYALGWARVQTPGPLGAIGINPELLQHRSKRMPDVARGHESTLVFYHNGSMSGNLAAINLIPSTQGAVLVLTNSLALNDVADWIGQLYLEAYLGVADRNDYILWAHETAEIAVQWYSRLNTELEANRIHGTAPRRLTDENEGTTSLQMAFQGRTSEVFPLAHYQYDIFTWLQPRDEFMKRGRLVGKTADYYKICFGPNTQVGVIDFLTWWYDGALTAPEHFIKGG
ncbi:beta-lactamase/transpeptidase-like protein [Astrocystis sublimbata]|nr:beta-lactamase/transpeptidase-like protein [Astrocystis sublimbata]